MSDKLEQEARGIITIYKPEISVYCQCNMTYPFLNRVAPQIHQLSISKVGQHCILLATASHVHPKKMLHPTQTQLDCSSPLKVQLIYNVLLKNAF